MRNQIGLVAAFFAYVRAYKKRNWERRDKQ